ncbi:hypothetical protein PMG11_05028 [Penicillium brasilianum]|uniref:UspA domain-containing protein n=1 Tax=Penicillium brasilianum TaxID=104259 RepID=A0A0F7VEL8_PENBI|nr:hypothetical protein PMG11_05028 [Penicillium brasilianum]
MSYQADSRVSPTSSSSSPGAETEHEEDIQFPDHQPSSQSLSLPSRPWGFLSLHRAVQDVLLPPPVVGGRRFRRSGSRSRRGARSPVEPFIPSPLRAVSSAMSAANSPERQQADTEDVRRRSFDQPPLDDRRASTAQGPEIDDDAKSDISTVSSEKTGSKKKTAGRKAMAAVMSGLEGRLFPRSLSRGRESSRGSSSRRSSSLDLRSPSSDARRSRSVSPTNRSFQSESQPITPTTSKTGSALKMESTHNKSDEALVKPSGSMPTYVQPAEHGESGERLAKDVFDRDNNIIESSSEDDDDGDDDESDEDDDYEGSGDDEPIPGVTFVTVDRGRKDKKRDDITNITASDFNKPKDTNPTTTEQQQQAPKRNIPGMDKKPRKSVLKTVIRPQTNYEIPTPRARSAAGTPCGSDDEEEEAAINRAQGLSIYVSTIDNRVPNRSIRTIVRGEFDEIQKEADEGRRRQRKYLVATDLSQESEYALEWTIGGLLRDGDTMYAIYAMHEDAATSSVQVGEGAKAMQDTMAVVGSQTKEVSRAGTLNILGRLSSGVSSKAGSVDARASPAAEAERTRAVEKISDMCIGFLRKTGLQVRIAVEVIHCKSPKQMITEAIDELEPTLAIVGARGQSALKGVLLGSFSNYLIANSSAPVMVARHKLQRQLPKQQANARLANNLNPSKTLLGKLEAEAKAKANATTGAPGKRW